MESLVKWGNWKLIGILFVICYIIGTIGWALYEPSLPVSSALYKSIQLFSLNTNFPVYPIPWILEIARFFAPIIAVAIVLKLVISLVWKTTRDLKLLGIKNHIVIWGLNAETNYLLENLLGNSSRIVLITSTHEMSDFPALKPARRLTVIFADEAESLSDKTRLCQKIHLESAKSVFVMTSDDANNIETVEKIEAYLDGCEKKRVALEARKTENINCELQVFVHIDDEHTMNFMKHCKGNDAKRNVSISFFNTKRMLARHLIDKFSPDRYRRIREGDSVPATILVVGLSDQGAKILTEAALLYHFANHVKPRIVVSDRDVKRRMRSIYENYPLLGNVAEIVEVEFLDLIRSEIDWEIFSTVSSCFVTTENEGESSFVARKLRQIFEVKADSDVEGHGRKVSTVPAIVAVIPILSRFLDIVPETREKLETVNINISNPGEVLNTDNLFSTNEEIEKIAMYFHWEYNKGKDKTLDKVWNELEDSEKDSNRYAARHLPIKLRFLGAKITDTATDCPTFNQNTVTEDQKRTMHIMEHRRWMAYRELNGFVYGQKWFKEDGKSNKEVMNILMINNSIKSWDELEPNIKEIDSLFASAGQAIAELNKKIVVDCHKS